MLLLAADENFRWSILDGLRDIAPELDILTVQAAGYRSRPDGAVVAWASSEGRVLLSHDYATVPDAAYGLIAAGQPMAGVIMVGWTDAVGWAVDSIATLALAGTEGDFRDQVIYL